MSTTPINYEPYEWEDSPNTPITAENLNHIEEGIKEVSDLINLLMDSRSHIGSIVQSTTLDTEEKVINLYGGIKWELIQGRFLLGKSDEYEIGSTGGSKTNTHYHYQTVAYDGSDFYATKTPDGVHSRVVTKRRAQISPTTDETTTTREDSTYEQTIDIMPPYKTVYIWERVE